MAVYFILTVFLHFEIPFMESDWYHDPQKRTVKLAGNNVYKVFPLPSMVISETVVKDYKNTNDLQSTIHRILLMRV